MKASIVLFLKRNPFLLNVIAFTYSILSGSNVWRYAFRRDVKFKGAFLYHTHLNVRKGGRLFIGPKCQMNRCYIDVWGGRFDIKGNQTCVNNSRFLLRDNACKISIDSDFSMQGGSIQCAEGKTIKIGKHCMFSGGIEIMSTDLHPIYSVKDRHIINAGKDVIISDHVWLGAHVRILKGTYIAHDVIVGNSSLVAGRLENSFSVYAGIPARCIKKDVCWSRSWDDV